MPLVINTNTQALNAQRNLGITGGKMGKALEQLSSGLRINRAADDAAGLAISEKLRSQVRGLTQGARNAQDGISMLQTAEGALNEVTSMLQRMRELSVQAGNSTLGAADRTAVGEEMLTLKNEIDNTASRTKFNGLALLTGALSTSQSGGTAIVGLAMNTTTTSSISSIDVSKLKSGTTYTLSKVSATVVRLTDGTNSVDATVGAIGATGQETITFTGALQASITIVGAAAKAATDIGTDLDTKTIITAAGSGTASYQVGAQASDTISVGYANMQSTAIGTGGSQIGVLITDNTSVSSVAKANTLLSSVDQAIQDVSTQRAKFGAAQNQIEAAINSLGVAAENLSASESRIRDADIAEVSTRLVSAQIMQQAGVSVLSQANSSAQVVTTLLQRM
ncbi:MAG: flagellin [Chloroflexi bacterium]|nr:MAG: flagellin [Chloroflexota bacterium]